MSMSLVSAWPLPLMSTAASCSACTPWHLAVQQAVTVTDDMLQWIVRGRCLCSAPLTSLLLLFWHECILAEMFVNQASQPRSTAQLASYIECMPAGSAAWSWTHAQPTARNESCIFDTCTVGTAKVISAALLAHD